MKIKFIEPAYFLYLLTLYLNSPAEKQLVYRKVCLGHYNDTFCNSLTDDVTKHEEDIVQEESARWNMYLSVIKLLPTMISTMYFGAWSDGAGRKKFILIGLLGETLYAINCFINTWYFSLPLYFMFIGSAVTGICGNLGVILMGTLAYIGDVSSPDKRTIRITMLDAGAFLSAVIALISGGIIIDQFGFIYVYAIDVGIYLLALFYLLLVKESYKPTETVNLKGICCGSKLREYGKLFSREDNYWDFMLLIACFSSLSFIINGGEDSIFVLYLLHKPLVFTATTIGYAFAAFGSIKVIGAIIISLIVKGFNWRDSSLIFICSVAVLGYNICLAFSKENWEVYATFVWGLGLSTGISACRSALSKLVLEEELGKLNSIICTLQCFVQLLASISMSKVYEYTVEITPSFTLYIISGVCAVPILFSILLRLNEARSLRRSNGGFEILP